MDLDITSGHIYIGRNVGSPIDKALDKARKSIEICSPYLSPRFIDKLIEKHERDGVAVTLITTNEFLKGPSGYSIGTKLVRQIRHTSEKALTSRKRTRYFGLFLLILAIASVAAIITEQVNDQFKMSIVGGASFLASLIAFSTAANMRIYSYTYSPRINFIACNAWDRRMAPHNYLIHTKAYVVDRRRAFLGSCNFSPSGFTFNHEFRLDLPKSDDAKAISDEIRSMHTSMMKMAIPIQTLGRMFNKEPKN